MRRPILLLLITLTCAGLSPPPAANAQNVEWLADLEAAQQKAKADNKLVLLDFTGSDWCGWCIKLKREVFDTSDFAQFAAAKLVLVEVDFPRHKTMAHLHQQANARLAKAYHVTSYPTLVILNPNGQEIGRMSYVAGGPSRFIAELERVAKMRTTPVLPPPSPELEREAELRSRPAPHPPKPFTWTPPPSMTPIAYGPLALKSLSGTKDRRMVLINNATM